MADDIFNDDFFKEFKDKPFKFDHDFNSHPLDDPFKHHQDHDDFEKNFAATRKVFFIFFSVVVTIIIGLFIYAIILVCIRLCCGSHRRNRRGQIIVPPPPSGSCKHLFYITIFYGMSFFPFNYISSKFFVVGFANITNININTVPLAGVERQICLVV